MIKFILESYFTLILAISMGAIGVFIFGLYFILKVSYKEKQKKTLSIIPTVTLSHREESSSLNQPDINAIAGQDIIATQLDLARAYIETGRTQLAKKILIQVSEKGQEEHQKEANYLLSILNKSSQPNHIKPPSSC